MSSIYWWQGAFQEAAESVIILKTRSALVPALAERVRQLHGHDCPCVVALPIGDGNPDYLRSRARPARPEIRGTGVIQRLLI